MIVGETHFVKNHHPGTVILDGQKFSFTIIDDMLCVAGKNKVFMDSVMIKNHEQLDPFEFSSLLFGFCLNQLKAKATQDLELV